LLNEDGYSQLPQRRVVFFERSIVFTELSLQYQAAPSPGQATYRQHSDYNSRSGM
jgi:hypothetical protein